ncbi:single-stranded-DNA-specific exonuclease RecJ [Paenibacillus alginolyticus]|uniref:Single-stranded-DNA-specific exonuclease RecJ n=2 Tax=Paenibacillus alginolyticus TaxID=59839 RepID=A0ABT4GMW7_9BACL|nr:single-stranded-DNA-specific exonuclease RecJ [Paenibacillus alginolyticus]MCY9697338.1 single-stranded-DNA-specific exonuclease RecJ [Paenibacillus alginolyticus]
MNWLQRKFDYNEHLVTYFARCFNIDPLIIKILFSRNIKTEKQITNYMYPEMEDLHDPFLLNDMKKAVYRIAKAIQRKENIVIFGDYDADGITSSCLLYKALYFLKAEVNVVLPLRKEGYGLSATAVERIHNEFNASLIVTVDNGSNAHEALATAKEKGIDVIVTDHHEITNGIPLCYAFINPMREDSTYPFRRLAGVGVALKVTQALFQAGKMNWQKHIWNYLELAAIGTVADVMPLVDENRIIVSLGLSKMNMNPSSIIKHWKQALKIEYFTSTDIAFRIAPMINASGRVDNPNHAVSLFIKDSVNPSDLFYFERVNEIRKKLVEEQYVKLENHILEHKYCDQDVIVAQGEYDEGIIGILAAKAAQRFLKPSIIIDSTGKGSARSVQNKEFSIINTIQRASSHLSKFGGHQAAAGLSMEVSNLSNFRNAIQLSAQEEPKIEPMLFYDFERSFEDFPKTLIDDFQLLEPTGMGNLKPIFKTTSQINHVEVFGKKSDHLKLIFKQKEALFFSMGSLIQEFTDNTPYHFLYTVNSKKNFLIHGYDK